MDGIGPELPLNRDHRFGNYSLITSYKEEVKQNFLLRFNQDDHEFIIRNKMHKRSLGVSETIFNYFDDDDLFYFEPGNVIDFSSKVLMAYNDLELVNKKIKNGKRKVKSLDWEIQKNKLVSIISQ